MPQRSPDDLVEDVAFSLHGTGNLQAWDSDGSLWVHSNFVIRVPSEINTHFITTFPTNKGEVLIAMSLYITGSACLVSFRDEIFSKRALPIVSSLEPIFVSDNERCSILVRLASANWSVVKMDIWLVLFLSNGVVNEGIDIFSKMSFEMSVKCSLVYCYLLWFDQNLFNLIARI